MRGLCFSLYCLIVQILKGHSTQANFARQHHSGIIITRHTLRGLKVSWRVWMIGKGLFFTDTFPKSCTSLETDIKKLLSYFYYFFPQMILSLKSKQLRHCCREKIPLGVVAKRVPKSSSGLLISSWITDIQIMCLMFKQVPLSGKKVAKQSFVV